MSFQAVSQHPLSDNVSFILATHPRDFIKFQRNFASPFASEFLKNPLKMFHYVFRGEIISIVRFRRYRRKVKMADRIWATRNSFESVIFVRNTFTKINI